MIKPVNIWDSIAIFILSFPTRGKKWEANVSNNEYYENYNPVFKNKLDFFFKLVALPFLLL